ncbi:hypothetical protein ABL78_0484 [Leptomonas seymouri]|uniref:Uncharacterized protein n=1 Tax=Leptomonas seymouri TaxID=5684 RepID=A0A0N1PEJ1_LEPSE|nr:hypothetical protein ABL78_0484 [Leptomonas seymouri]|eukprot:KPI90408.1 hypothetical protein ABL78_0484 [Leptomonas seymouri]
MLTECNVSFHFSPLTATWTTNASLRLNAELLGYHRDAASCRPKEDCAAAPLQVLLYVSRFHQLQEVFLEEVVEEEEEGAGGAHLAHPLSAWAAPNCEAERSSQPLDAFPRADRGEARRVCTALRTYSWRPYSQRIQHESSRNDRDLPSSQASASGAVGQASGGVDTSPGVNAAVNTPQALFSTLFSSIPSSVGCASSEDGDDGDPLVVQFDSLPSSSDAQESTGQSKGAGVIRSGEGEREASSDAQPRNALNNEAVLTPPKEQSGLAVAEQSTQRHLSVSTTQATTFTDAAAPQRRLLLIPPAAAKEGGARPPPSAARFSDATSPRPTESTLQRRRVLNINAAVTPLAPLQTAAPESTPQTEPPPPPSSAKPSHFVEAATPALAAADPERVAGESAKADPKKPSPSSSAEQESWTPYIFCCTYGPSLPSAAATTTPIGGDGDVQAQRSQLKRHLVAVRLNFTDASVVNSATPNISAFSKMLHNGSCEKGEAPAPSKACWSRASVASCGWFTQFPAYSSTTSQNLSCHRNGYAFIMGDASLHTCWICPLAASILEEACGADGACKDGTSEEGCSEDSSLIAGPLIDLWVSAVSAYVDTQDLGCNSPPLSAQGIDFTVKREQQDDARDRASVSQPEGSRTISLALPCLDFIPSWLSQLSCSFGPLRLACDASGEMFGASFSQMEESGAPALRSTCLQLPSTSTAGLMWTASQTTADCIVLRPFFSSQRESSDSMEEGQARCVCLQSSVDVMDSIYAYFLEVQRRWLKEMGALGAAVSEASLDAPVCEDLKAPRVVLTRVAPASLSLLGGAAGSANGVVLAEETARAADFAGTGLSRVVGPRKRCCSAAALRARVAITAAFLQYLLWQSVEAAGAPDATDVSREDAAAPVGKRNFCALAFQSAADMRDAGVRFLCVARAVALQWVCGAAAVALTNAAAVQQFLAEERSILTSTCAVGRLIDTSGDRAADGKRMPSTAALQMLHSLQQRYSASLSAALSWLSRCNACMRWLRSRGVSTASFLADERRLCLWALQPYTSLEGISSLLAKGEPLGLRLCKGHATPRSMDNYLLTCMRTSVHTCGGSGEPEDGLATPLRGTISVRIQHAPVLNALHIQLNWEATSPCSPASLAAVVSTDAATTVELPFFLFVFVLQEAGPSATEDSIDASEDEESSDGAFNGGCSSESMVRLYQVTPFSWHLPAQNCTTAGSTAHLSLSVMHTLDLVARRPDAFEDFSVQAVAGRASAMEGKRTQSQGGRGGAVKRRRTAKSTATGNSLASKASLKGGEEGHVRKRETRQHRLQPTGAPARKRRRARRRSDHDDSDSVDTERSEDIYGSAEEDSAENDEANNEEHAVAVGVEDENEGDDSDVDDEGDTLFLNLGGGTSEKTGKFAVPTGRREAAGRLDTESFSALDTARVIPLVVFRKDGAAPLLDVEVQYAELLAARLLAAGYSGDATTSGAWKSNNNNTCSTGATTALCHLLSHLTGFATVHAAMPDLVAQLRERQEQVSALSLSAVPSYAEASALTEQSVLSAYAALLRGVLIALNSKKESSTALRSLVAIPTVLANILSATNVAQSLQAALSEYAHQDAACRARLLTHTLEADSEVTVWRDSSSTGPAAVTDTYKRSTTKERQRQQQRRREVEQRNRREVEATWALDARAKAECVSSFYNSVLPATFRRRQPALCRLLPNSEGATADLEKWTRNGNSFYWLSHAALREKIDVLQGCKPQSDPNLKVSAQSTSPAALSPPATSACCSTLRLQLGNRSLPASTATSLQKLPSANAPTLLQCPAAPPSLMEPSSPSSGPFSLSTLRDMCAAHLDYSSTFSYQSKRCGSLGGRLMDNRQGCCFSQEAGLHILSASADALMTSIADARSFSSAKTAAAALGLTVAQLALRDVQR